jgi:hypothetical protein
LPSTAVDRREHALSRQPDSHATDCRRPARIEAREWPPASLDLIFLRTRARTLLFSLPTPRFPNFPSLFCRAENNSKLLCSLVVITNRLERREDLLNALLTTDKASPLLKIPLCSFITRKALHIFAGTG